MVDSNNCLFVDVYGGSFILVNILYYHSRLFPFVDVDNVPPRPPPHPTPVQLIVSHVASVTLCSIVSPRGILLIVSASLHSHSDFLPRLRHFNNLGEFPLSLSTFWIRYVARTQEDEKEELLSEPNG